MNNKKPLIYIAIGCVVIVLCSLVAVGSYFAYKAITENKKNNDTSMTSADSDNSDNKETDTNKTDDTKSESQNKKDDTKNKDPLAIEGLSYVEEDDYVYYYPSNFTITSESLSSYSSPDNNVLGSKDSINLVIASDIDKFDESSCNSYGSQIYSLYTNIFKSLNGVVNIVESRSFNTGKYEGCSIIIDTQVNQNVFRMYQKSYRLLGGSEYYAVTGTWVVGGKYDSELKSSVEAFIIKE